MTGSLRVVGHVHIDIAVGRCTPDRSFRSAGFCASHAMAREAQASADTRRKRPTSARRTNTVTVAGTGLFAGPIRKREVLSDDRQQHRAARRRFAIPVIEPARRPVAARRRDVRYLHASIAMPIFGNQRRVSVLRWGPNRRRGSVGAAQHNDDVERNAGDTERARLANVPTRHAREWSPAR